MIENIVLFLKDKRLAEVHKHIDGKLLDIGCGDNALVKRFYKKGTGVDVFNYYGNVDMVVKGSSRLPFEKESFDTITIVAALNHIANYEKTLKEAYRLLSPNGKLLLTMPIGFPQKVWHKIAHPYDDDQIFRGINEEEERYFIPIQEIQESLTDCGFSSVKRKRFLYGLNNLIVAKKQSD